MRSRAPGGPGRTTGSAGDPFAGARPRPPLREGRAGVSESRSSWCSTARRDEHARQARRAAADDQWLSVVETAVVTVRIDPAIRAGSARRRTVDVSATDRAQLVHAELAGQAA